MPDQRSNNSDDAPTSANPGGDEPTAHARTSDEAETATSGGVPLPPPSLKRLGDFELLRELGRGGMGVVYEARQVSLKRRVALKVLPPALGMSPQAKQRFEREAQAAAKLHHTNIVAVHAIGEHDGHHYYAMDLIEGQSLDHVLRDVTDQRSNPLLDKTLTQAASALLQRQKPPADSSPATPPQGGGMTSSLDDTSAGSRPWFDAVAKLIAEVADGLDYAHGRGVIHRDIKPANLMLSSEGRLCITDFGLARIVQEPGMTVSGSFLGTPAYMSPEQIAAGRMKLDHRTDVYSLGAVLYEMLTLQRPFPGDSREEIIGAIMTKDPRRPRRFNAKIPQDLETICLKALEKDPDRRYATAGAFAQDMRQYLQGGLITARRAGPLRRAAKSIRRHPVTATVAAAVIVVSLLVGLNWRTLVSWRQADIQRLVSDARLHIVRGNIKAALEKTNDILTAAPANVDGLLIRSRVHLHRWRYWDAVRDARAVLRLDPENWEAHLLVATAAARGDLYSVPVDEHLATVEGRVPDTADAYFLRGMLAVGSVGATWDGIQQGIAWLDKALEMDPGHVGALQARSRAYKGLKDLPRAMADAERLIVALPRSALGYIEKGSIYQALHDEEGALEAANRAIELDPISGDGYSNRAAVHAIRGQVDEQIADLTRAIESNPTASRYQARARAHQNNHEFDLAIADAERCIEINPDRANCYQTKWWSYWMSGRREEALSVLDEIDARAEQWVREEGKVWRHAFRYDYYYVTGDVERSIGEADRLIELLPGKPLGYSVRVLGRRMLEGEAGTKKDCDRLAALELDLPSDLLSRANALTRDCNRTGEALQAYQAAIAMAPNWADPYLARAGLLLNVKRYDEAMADYDKAQELAPNWLNVRSKRAEAYLRLGRFEESLADIERVIELGGEDSNLRWNQAQALHRLGRTQAALDVLAGYLEGHPGDVGVLQHQAAMLFGLGRLDDAIASLDKAIEANPNDGWPYQRRSVYSMFKPRQCDRALEDLKKAEELMPARYVGMLSRISQVHTEFAYSLCPGQSDLPRALELAQEAARYNTQSGLFKVALGLALYRNGSFEEARTALLDAIELEDRADAPHLFFVAMASQKLGLESEAASYYRQAVARVEETWPKSPEYKLVKNEAAQLLGIQP